MKPEEFLRRHWQKKPLLVRQAFPGFAGLVSVPDMTALLARDDTQARLVIEHPKKKRDRWELYSSPLEMEVAQMPPTHWTMLVQGLESLVPGGWDVLRAFSFLPAARVDDLMVSYAAEGGSVGPHDDLYDVFLVQGPGKRKWQIATKYDPATDDKAPLKILSGFQAEQEWVLEPGDMLYLPPRVAHWGTAVDGPCFTYSVGFLAPSHDALAQNFLAFLGQERGELFREDVLYADPDVKRPKDPLVLDDDMVGRVEELLEGLRWKTEDVAEFTGRLLTGPKPNVVFRRPKRAVSDVDTARRLHGAGQMALALPSRGLVRGGVMFFNGERHALPRAELKVFHKLFAERAVQLPVRLGARATSLVTAFVNAGWIQL